MVPRVGTKGCHGKELPVAGLETYGPQPVYHRLPLQATADPQRLELIVPNLGTTGYHCKELPVPRGWNSWFLTSEPGVTIASNCRFPEVRTYVFEAKRLSLERTAGSQSLKLMVPNLKKHTLPVEGSVDSQKFELMVLNVVLFCFLGR